MNVLRAGSTGLVLGHRVMAPSTLGTFLRAFTFGHVRQLDRVLDRRSPGVGGGRGAGRRAAGDRYRQLRRRGPRLSEAGRQLRVHQAARVSPDPRGPLGHRGDAAHPQPQGEGQHAARARAVHRRVARRVTRAGHAGEIIIRADSGLRTTSSSRTSTAAASVLDRREADKDDPGADRADPRGRLGDRRDYPDDGEAQIAETELKGFRLIVRRTRLIGTQAELFPDWRHHALRPTAPIPTAGRGHRSPRPRHRRARDPRPQRPSPRALPFRPVCTPTAPGP